MAELRCQDLHVTLPPAVQALRGVSATLPAGKVTAVIGPSGSGKSTLLNVLAGLLKPDRGTVYIADQDVTKDRPERRRLGIVFQDLRLFPFLSARENVAFAPEVSGLRGEPLHQRVAEALRLTRAEAFADRPVSALSGGEQQRVALARALAMAPRGLLLDEPFSGLDAELRRGLRAELRTLIQRLQLTTLIITHDRDDVFALAEQVLVLRAGQLAQASSVVDCYARPRSAFVATLLGEATLLAVEERAGPQSRVAGTWIDTVGEGVQAVLRPENLELSPAAAAPLRGPLVDAQFSAGRWRITVALAAGPVVALVDRLPTENLVPLRLIGPAPLVP